MKILGIETSCDETAAAVVEGVVETPDGRLRQQSGQSTSHVTVLSNVISSQIEIHKKYGGVVPEVAARGHVLNILPVVNEALENAGIDHCGLLWKKNRREDILSKSVHLDSGSFAAALRMTERGWPLDDRVYRGGIDAIAVTVGPGLITSLIVGVETAKSLAYAWNLPLIAVNHVEGHIYANFIDCESQIVDRGSLIFPVIVLTVSGGHTMLVLMKGHGRLEVVGDTLDDAAGEAFDKAAAMMKIGYPGGPAVAQRVSQIAHRISHSSTRTDHNTPSAIRDTRYEIRDIVLPRPMLNKNNFDFSFSGLKTALLYQLKKDADWKKRIPEYCYEFQQAVIDVLVSKAIKAAKKHNVKTVMLAGGVAANVELRRQLADKVKIELPETALSIPDLAYTTDNAAMVAAAGCFKVLRKKFTPWWKVKADCNYRL